MDSKASVVQLAAGQLTELSREDGVLFIVILARNETSETLKIVLGSVAQ